MSVDLDQIGAELEKLKAELGVRVLTITYHPTFFQSISTTTQKMNRSQ